jgi:hypothetical protein
LVDIENADSTPALADGVSIRHHSFADEYLIGVPGDRLTIQLRRIAELLNDPPPSDPNSEAPVWLKQVKGPSVVEVRGVAALSAGAVVATGIFEQTARLGLGEPGDRTLTSRGGSTNAYVARYASDGQLQWVRQIGGTGGCSTANIAVLSNGSAVVTGSIVGTVTFDVDGTARTTRTAAGLGDLFLACYDAFGTLQWTKQVSGPNVSGLGVSTGPGDQIYVVGDNGDTALFGAGEPTELTLRRSDDTAEFFVSRFGPDGEFGWARSTRYASAVRGNQIDAVPEGGCVVTGYYAGEPTFGEGDATITRLPPTPNNDQGMFVAKYAATGALVWASSGRAMVVPYATGYCFGSTVTAVPDGATAVVGYLAGKNIIGAGNSAVTIGSDNERGLFIARFGVGGAPTHVERVTITGNAMISFSMEALNDNSFVIAGGLSGTATFGEGSTVLSTATSEYDGFLAYFTPDGKFSSAMQFGGAGSAFGRSVSRFADDSLVIGGTFSSDLTLGADGPNATTLLTIKSTDTNGFLARLRRGGGF